MRSTGAQLDTVICEPQMENAFRSADVTDAGEPAVQPVRTPAAGWHHDAGVGYPLRRWPRGIGVKGLV